MLATRSKADVKFTYVDDYDFLARHVDKSIPWAVLRGGDDSWRVSQEQLPVAAGRLPPARDDGA